MLLLGCSEPYKDNYIIHSKPIQTKLDQDNKKSFNFKEFNISPLYNFEIKARVLAIKSYSDDLSISGMDFALGWDDMSKMNIINDMSIWQENRWYKWQTKDFKISRKKIEENSANMHLIPATDEIARKIAKINQYETIKITGRLVNVKGDLRTWKTSVVRTDTRGGSCEIIYVEDIKVISKRV
jgi:hypothetical protein